MAVWMVLTLFVTDPVMTIYFNGLRGVRVGIILGLLMSIIPIVFIKLLKEFKVISDIKMPSKEERFTAYAIVSLLYIVNYQLLYQLGSPRSLRLVILGTTLILLSLTIVNRLFKISAHMASIGGLIGYLAILTFQGNNFHGMLIISILLAGIIASARLYAQASYILKEQKLYSADSVLSFALVE